MHGRVRIPNTTRDTGEGRAEPLGTIPDVWLPEPIIRHALIQVECLPWCLPGVPGQAFELEGKAKLHFLSPRTATSIVMYADGDAAVDTAGDAGDCALQSKAIKTRSTIGS